MKKLSAFLLMCFLFAFGFCVQPGFAKVATEKKVVAFYYPWYGTPEVSGKWSHWSWMGGKPHELDEEGHPNLRIPFHPEGGVYDSTDPELIRSHIELSEAAGIDVLISSWWGTGGFTDEAFGKLLDAIEEAESPLRATVYYETVPGRDAGKAEEDFEYILEKYGGREGFFRVGGAPVIFIYARAMFEMEVEEWMRVVKKLKKKAPVLFIADMDFFAYFGIFDGIHRYNPVGDVRGGVKTEEIYKNLMKVGKDKNMITAVTVIPGYDDVLLGRDVEIAVGRRDGALYREMWEGAIRLRPDWILITSFNEWHEGTQIEPSTEHGGKYIDMTAGYAAKFKGGP